jgi:hypothetical protein
MRPITRFLDRLITKYTQMHDACQNKENMKFFRVAIPTVEDVSPVTQMCNEAIDCETRAITKECLDFTATMERNLVSRRKTMLDFCVCNARRCNGTLHKLELKKKLIERLP